jgi:iron complex transport system substrate-binding protein
LGSSIIQVELFFCRALPGKKQVYNWLRSRFTFAPLCLRVSLSRSEFPQVATAVKNIEDIAAEVVDAAYKLHTGLGPGLLESVYEAVLERDLKRRGLRAERQKVVSFDYDGMKFSDVLRIDLLVEDSIVVEIKSVERMLPVHAKQVLTYLRLLDLRIGFLINFGAPTLKAGLHRVVNGYVPSAPSRLRVNQI